MDVYVPTIEKLKELTKSFNPQDLDKVKNALHLPPGLFQDISDTAEFVYALKAWDDFDPCKFDQVMVSLGDQWLVSKARELPWLCSPHPNHLTPKERPPMEELVYILKSEMVANDWRLIHMSISDNLVSNPGFETTSLELEKKGLFTPDLSLLCSIMTAIQRLDLAARIKTLGAKIAEIPGEEFKQQLLSALSQ